MNPVNISKLRESLRKNLKRLIGNPAIEEKELAAFDLIMNRRQFLKAAQYTAIGALVASVYPPTAWGRFDKKLHVNPKSVGLTSSDQASVSQATQVVTGTELFQDTIYAKPVVAAEAVNTHALIEGTRSRLRFQSDLLSNNPDEYAFLDTDYHFGPPELIQVEPTGNGDFELVHYYYPRQPRTDGARTDGLVRQVISGSTVLNNPTKVLAVTGTYTNRFNSQDSNQTSSASYVVCVLTDDDAFFFFGFANWSVTPPYNESPDYNISWQQNNTLGFGYTPFAEKYTSAAWVSPGDNAATEYAAEQQAEHLIFYADGNEGFADIITLADGGPDKPYCIETLVGYPDGINHARIVHIDWDQTQDGYLITNIVMASTQENTDGSVTYSLHSINKTAPNNTSNVLSADKTEFGTGSDAYDVWYIVLKKKFQTRSYNFSSSTLQNGKLKVDYSSLRSVLGLHTTIIDGNWYHVKMVNFEGHGVFLLTIIKVGPPDEVQQTDPFYFGGLFPLAFPDAAGLGTITALSGGTSKFSGFRFVASDADGNVFLMRQRRVKDSTLTYPNPIYAQYTADGDLKTRWDATADELPAGTTLSSNLNDLQAWVDASAPGLNYVYNFLLDAALSFGTDDSNQCQAVWLGNTFQAAYASKRFALDSEHVVVKKVQIDGTDEYAAFTMFKNPLHNTWHQRQIATQILPEDLGIQENGDHYQATVTPANTYGKVVSLQTDDNANLMIEVRADSPCTVIDDTNNQYYDVDPYTSFMAPPDQATGRLCLLVKAETFSQVLYVRLVDTSGLQPSKSDAALLTSTNVNTYAWQSMNLALQAQQRMGNGAQPSSLLEDDMPLVDTTVYVTGDTLYENNQDAPWKGNYSQSDVQDNLGNMATYLNTSGQNLISATGQLSLGASPDGVTIDPLYAVTSYPVDSSRPTVTTQFAYDTGDVITTQSGPSTMNGGQLGSLWSSISHALHDALHWLQHVESEAYKDLASGGVSIVSAVDSITVTVGKDIMKQVNGVEQDLKEVVTTVEEYASVVANLVVTIVESSFIYTFIKAIIALISLFLHFKDILKLSDSFSNLFSDIVTGANGRSLPSIPSDFSSWDIAGQYLGNKDNTDNAFNGINSGDVTSELIKGLLDAISGNPLTKKILNKGASAVSTLLNKINPPLPLNFDMDLTTIQGVMDDLSNLEDNLVDGVANMGVDIISTFIDSIAADIADPQQTYNNLASGLGAVAEALDSDVLSPVFDFVDKYTKNAPDYAVNMIEYDAYITLDITVLVDLCKLFKIGSISSSKLNLKASEAIFFPLAVIAWVAVYTYNGKSIDSVDKLDDDFLLAPGEVGISGATLWNLVRLAVDFAMTELGAISFLIKAVGDLSENSEPNSIEKLFIALGKWFNLIRWMNDFVYTAANWDPATGKPFDYSWVASRLATACTAVGFTLPLKNLDQGTGWANKDPRGSDIAQAVNFLMNLSVIVYDAVEFGKTTPDIAQITNFVGKCLTRLQILPIFLYNLNPNYFKNYLVYFFVPALTCPIGFLLQYLAQSGDLSALPPSGPGSTSPGPGRRRRRRRRPHGTGPKNRDDGGRRRW